MRCTQRQLLHFNPPTRRTLGNTHAHARVPYVITLGGGPTCHAPTPHGPVQLRCAAAGPNQHLVLYQHHQGPLFPNALSNARAALDCRPTSGCGSPASALYIALCHPCSCSLQAATFTPPEAVPCKQLTRQRQRIRSASMFRWNQPGRSPCPGPVGALYVPPLLLRCCACCT